MSGCVETKAYQVIVESDPTQITVVTAYTQGPAGPAGKDGSGGGSLTVEGPGGTPSVASVNTIQIAGGTVEDKTGGVVQISVGVAGMGSQTKATFLAAPTAEDGAPTFRAIAAGDLPSTVAFQNATNTFQSLQTFQKAIAGANGSGTTSIDLNYLGSFAILYVASAGHFFTDSLFVDQNISANNVVAEGVIAGDGSLIIGLDASNISFGTLNAARLATSGVTAATYGSATASPEIAVDKYGRITAAANKTITPSWGNLVSVPANVDAFGNLVSVTDSLPYFTDSGKMALATYTSFARQLDDDPDAATARGTLGVNQPYISIDLPNGTYTILRSARHAFTINTAYGAVASAGSGTITVAINGTPITGLNAAAVTTTPADLTATAANTVSVGNVVTVTVAGLADNETIAATIQGTRT